MKTSNDKPVTSDKISDNETWNTCPDCNKSWKSKNPIRGLLHRTRTCDRCKRKGYSSRTK